MKTLIIIPAYNEQDNIQKVVDNIINNYPQFDYIVINDGSVDKTAQICISRGYNIIDLPINLGLAGAFQAGLKFAYKMGYDNTLQFDADGQHFPEYIQSMVECMENTNADIVIGSRYLKAKKEKSFRMLGSNLIAWAMYVTTGKRIKDPTSGMRLFNRHMIEEFAVDANFAPEPDTISFLLRNGAKVEEIQVEMGEREAGKSYLNPIVAVKYMFKIGISIVFIQWFRKRKGV